MNKYSRSPPYSLIFHISTSIISNRIENCSRTASVHGVCTNINVIFGRIRISIRTPNPQCTISFKPCNYVKWWMSNHRHLRNTYWPSVQRLYKQETKRYPYAPARLFVPQCVHLNVPLKANFVCATVRPPSMASWSKTKNVHKCYNHSANT